MALKMANNIPTQIHTYVCMFIQRSLPELVIQLFTIAVLGRVGYRKSAHCQDIFISPCQRTQGRRIIPTSQCNYHL